jgi:hypothetical protein
MKKKWMISGILIVGGIDVPGNENSLIIWTLMDKNYL